MFTDILKNRMLPATARTVWMVALLLVAVGSIFAPELKGQNTQILYRVNAGGDQIDAEPINWSADQAATFTHGSAKKGNPSPYLTITDELTEDLAFGVPGFTGTNDTGYPNKLFATERFSVSRNKISQTWDFPVSVPGMYTVNLLFAEIWEGAQDPGKRVFDVAVENKVVSEQFDATAAAGWNVALVQSYKVEVTDGNLDIDLLKEIQNPAIKGIEIIGPKGANANLPPQFAKLPLVRAEAGEIINATFTTTEKDGDAVTLSLSVKDQNGVAITPGTYTFTDKGDGTATLVWPTKPTDAVFYNATITATDKDGAVSKKFIITISEKVTKFLYRINAGGSALDDVSDSERMPFAADSPATPSEYVNEGSFYSTNKPVTVNPSVPAYVPLALFQTERFSEIVDGANMTWSFPVPDGAAVNVRIYLAEIFLTQESIENKKHRIFDIIINGDTVERAIDVFEEAGNYVGIMRSYNVTSNGSVTISFGAFANNPSVKGFEIIEIKPLTLSFTKKDATCFGGTGAATVKATGGTGPYTINWGTGIDPQQLLAGTYKVIVTDASGQEKSVEITIQQPEALSVTIEAANATAANATDGTATATVSGGTEPYTYAWGDGVNPEALGAGDYTLTVTDANGCSISEDFTIGDPETLAVDIKTTNPACFGGTGTAAVTVTGGTEPYTTVWQNNADPEALPAGEHTVVVTDAMGAQIEKKVVITQPESALAVVVNTVDASAFGAKDGSASLEISGGVSPYNILWGANNSNALAAGTYHPVVKDAAGCEKEVEVVIGQPAGLSVEVQVTNATCDTAGFVTLTIEGGTFPYNTRWSNNVNPDSLLAGTYQVTVTDANKASVTQEVIVGLDCEEPTAVDNPENEDLAFKLYPVPGDGLLHISLPNSLAGQTGTVRIYSTTGQQVFVQKTSFLNDAAIDISHFKKGTYIMEVIVNNKVFKRRFVVTR